VYNSVMELANQSKTNSDLNSSQKTTSKTDPIRIATADDKSAINRLLQMASLSHVHVDWRLPSEWIGSPGFVVWAGERQEDMANVHNIQACLAVAADPLPAAWVRVAGINDKNNHKPFEFLAPMMDRVSDYLRETAVVEIGWLAAHHWSNSFMLRLGFSRINQIETYLKDDLKLPHITTNPSLRIRPVQYEDMPLLEKIEAEAFEPLWRHSAHSLILAQRQAISFDLAEFDGQVVGFQLSAHSDDSAHLVRLTVKPERQRSGIGSALLAHAIMGYREKGMGQVSLNTQVDNIPSQRLYRKFGFYASGQRLPVWARAL